MLVDAGIGAIAGFAGDSGAGSKNLKNRRYHSKTFLEYPNPQGARIITKSIRQGPQILL